MMMIRLLLLFNEYVQVYWFSAPIIGTRKRTFRIMILTGWPESSARDTGKKTPSNINNFFIRYRWR